MTPPGNAKERTTTAGPPPPLTMHYSEWSSHQLSRKKRLQLQHQLVYMQPV